MSHKIECAMGDYSAVILQHVKSNSEIILEVYNTVLLQQTWNVLWSKAMQSFKNHYQNFILGFKINRKPVQRSQHWRDAGPLPCASQQSSCSILYK